MKKLEEVFKITVADAATGNTLRFTPQDGLVIGCSIYHNNEDGTINAGIVEAKITDDSGTVISDMCDIRHYRNREASFAQGFKPLYLETKGKTFVLEIAASAAFSADFKASLVLIYENDVTKQLQNC